MSGVDRTSLHSYRRSVAFLSDDELRKEIWLMDEHIKYLQREDDQSAHEMLELLQIALEEKDRRAFNKGYI
jgi:hypothetical protein